MLGKASTIFLIGVIFLVVNADRTSGQQNSVELDRQVKAKINKYGAGAKVTVLLKDRTKVKGSIGQILDDSFDLTLSKNTQSSIVSYRDVQTVKRRGWSTTTKLALGGIAGAAALVLILHWSLSADDIL